MVTAMSRPAGQKSSLARWVNAQRSLRKRRLLDEVLNQRLNEIGFNWNRQETKTDETWMNWYHELQKYAREHGNPHVPRTDANIKLRNWVMIQRTRRYKPYGDAPTLTNDQVKLLDDLGFHWVLRERKWTERFDQLKQFREEHGHCDIEQEPGAKSGLLGWMSLQRHRNWSGKLPADRKAKLDSIGFESNAESTDIKWREMYGNSRRDRADHGDTAVPFRWKEDPKLARWVAKQRERRKADSIPDGQVRLLDELGFSWKMRERGTWDDRLNEIAAFKAKNGHCEIPLNYPENPKLGQFVNNTRTQRNSGKLAADRIAKLNALGFVWKSSRTVTGCR